MINYTYVNNQAKFTEARLILQILIWRYSIGEVILEEKILLRTFMFHMFVFKVCIYCPDNYCKGCFSNLSLDRDQIIWPALEVCILKNTLDKGFFTATLEGAVSRLCPISDIPNWWRPVLPDHQGEEENTQEVDSWSRRWAKASMPINFNNCSHALWTQWCSSYNCALTSNGGMALSTFSDSLPDYNSQVSANKIFSFLPDQLFFLHLQAHDS